MKGKTVKKSAVAYAVFLLLIVGIIAYIVLLAMRNFVTSLTTLKTQEITETYTLSMSGYIFRNEEIITSDSPCVAEYAISDGERVGVGDVIAELYAPGEGMSDEAAKNAESRLNAINTRIKVINSTSGNYSGASAALGAKDGVRENYVGMVRALSDGRLNDVGEWSDKFLAELTRYKYITGQSSDGAVSLSALSAERQTVLDSLGGKLNSLTCEKSGYFYYQTDGYEKTFDSGLVASLGLEELLNLTDGAKPTEYPGYVVGKAVYGTGWYLVCPTDCEICDKLNVGEIYNAVFEGENSVVMDLTVKRVLMPENREGRGAVIFHTELMPSGFSFKRVQSIKIAYGSTSGFRVPNGAVYTVDGVKGVYILENSVVYFRRISVVADCGWYSIVDTDGGTSESADVPYLQLNDLIITGGTNLYEGKIYY